MLVDKWIGGFLAAGKFEIKRDRRTIGTTTMTEQGSPLSPARFTIYISHMIAGAQKELREAINGRRGAIATC